MEAVQASATKQYPTFIDRLDPMKSVSKALIVEDDPFSQKFFSKVLSDKYEDLKIIFVKNYESALNAINNLGGFDLAILDIFLAGDKSGVDLYKTLLKLEDPPTIIMTSALEPEEYIKLFPKELAPPPFLKKPFRPEDCVDLIEAFTEGGAK